MTRQREPFVSGLYGRDHAPARPPALPVLAHMRALLADEIEQLNMVCTGRFDGVERINADPVAIAHRAIKQQWIDIIDIITADEVIEGTIARRLVRRGIKR